MTQNFEASKGVMEASGSGRGNMGARRYYSYEFLDMKMTMHMHMIVCVYGCEFRDEILLRGNERGTK